MFLVIVFANMLFVGAEFCSNVIGDSLRSGNKSISFLVSHSFGKFRDIVMGKDSFDVYKTVKQSYINLFGIVQRTVCNDFVVDADKTLSTSRLKNGYLANTCEKMSAELKESICSETENLHDYLADNGIDFLYIQLPGKICQYDKQLSFGAKDFSNENADSLLNSFASQGIDAFDIRQVIHENNIDHYSLFFKTDHHWTTNAAFLVSGFITDKLAIGYRFPVRNDITDINNYYVQTYKNYFLGSIGKRVGQYYAGVDDYSLILPKFSTEMSTTFYKKDGSVDERNGSFEDTFIFYENLEKRDYFYSNPYAAYLYGNPPLITMRGNETEKKILMLSDSYSSPVLPYLTLSSCSEIHRLDPRYYNDSVRQYIKEFNPDIVIVMVFPGTFSDNFFHFE